MSKDSLKIDIYSDLHLDTWVQTDWAGRGRHKPLDIKVMPTKGTDVCLFAGDAGNGPDWYARAMRLLKGKYRKVIGVPGNHDYYNLGCYAGMIDLEYHDPGNQVYVVDGFTIVTSTLWSNFRNSEISKHTAENAISDFRAIPGMTANLMSSLCHDAHGFLSEFAGRTDIVMTHFAPIRNSEHPAYAGSSHLNSYFINDEPEFVEQMKAKLWVHGHTHKKFDYEFKGTRVVANPIGYCEEEQNQPIFMPKHVEVKRDVSET